MARAKANRGRGQPTMQNTSPRQTRARSARAATVSAASPMSAPATVSAAASAVVSMGAPPPECVIREHFEDAPSLAPEPVGTRHGTPRGIF